jgi:hypothetical protein
VIVLYAITDHPGPPLPDLATLPELAPFPDLAPLRSVARRELAAVCAPAPEGEVTADALWRHERVVEALMEERDLLPIRYGTRVSDEAAAGEAIEANHDRLVKSLEFVRGAVEVAVRALAPQPRPAPALTGAAMSGADYLRARADEVAAQGDAGGAVHEPLSAAARAQVTRSPSLPGEMLRAAYLVDRDAVSAFSELVARVQAENPDLRLTCTGPWPPYSFAEQ